MTFRLSLILIDAVAFVALVIIAFFALRGRPSGTAPNLTTYYDDDVLEGPKLERVQGWALVFSAVIAASLPIYWLREPNRQEKMDHAFLERSITSGRKMFQPAGTFLESLGCATCHGAKGEGGAAPFALQPESPAQKIRQVIWKAPALNTVLLRFPREQVISIITYGRPGTPMPAWGLAGGGALNEQQVESLADYLQSIQTSSAKAMAQQAGITDPKTLFDNNCARCHTKGNSYGEPQVEGGGAFGPNLTNGDVLRQFPGDKGLADQIDFVTGGSQFQKQYGVRGIGSGRMPGFGRFFVDDKGRQHTLAVLTRAQIEAIVRFERSL